MKPTIDVVAALLVEDDKIFVAKRGCRQTHPNVWEFPGGKVEAGETSAFALARELKEELGIDVEVGPRFTSVTHEYDTHTVRLAFYWCRKTEGTIALSEHAEGRFDVPREWAAETFAAADRSVVSMLQIHRFEYGKESVMLEGKQLMLYPLEEADLALLLTDRKAFEVRHGLRYDGELLEGTELFAIFEGQVERIHQDPSHWLWHTFWMMVDHLNNIVGSICFKGPPVKGEVEIGYGISPKHEGKGYATEAVRTLSAWAFTQAHVDAVIAETETWNEKSKRVLIRNGFEPYKTTDTAWWWRLAKGK